MDNMTNVIEVWTFQRTKATEPRWDGSQTASEYAIEAGHPSPHTPMSVPPPDAPMRPAYYWLSPRYHQQLLQGLPQCTHGDEPGLIGTFCPDVSTDQDQGIVYLSEHGGQTVRSDEGNGGEVLGYRWEGTFFSTWTPAWDCSWQRQHGGQVTSTAAWQPPQAQRIATSQLFQGASAEVTTFHSGIAWQLSEIDECDLGLAGGTAGNVCNDKDSGNLMEQLSH